MLSDSHQPTILSVTVSCVCFGVVSITFGETPWLLEQIAVTDQEAPGVDDDAVISLFRERPSINAAGEIAFSALLDTGMASDDNNAIFGPISGAGSQLGVVARGGQLAPGLDDGTELDFFANFALNDAGDVAYFAFLRRGTGDVSSVNGDAIFAPTSGPGSQMGPVVRRGDAVPGTDRDLQFSQFFFPEIALNSSADLALWTDLEGSVVDPDRGVFVRSAGGDPPTGLVAQEGSLIAGETNRQTYIDFGDPALNDAGDAAFFAVFRTGSRSSNAAIFGPVSGPNSELGIVALGGDIAPNVTDGSTLRLLGDPAINNSGDVAFAASVETGSGPEVTPDRDEAVFAPIAGAGSPLAVIIREGQPVPGFDDGTVFAGGPNDFEIRLVGEVLLNNNGDLAFVAGLRSVDDTNDSSADTSALFARIDGELQLVAQLGDLVNVLDPVTTEFENRTISSIGLGREGFSDKGELAMLLQFSDGSRGVFKASLIPEPTTLAPVVLAALAAITRSRRNSPRLPYPKP